MKSVINNQESLESYIKYLRAQYDEHKYLRIDIKTGKQRTNLQNASLHKFCSDVARDLNEEGITFNMFFKDGIEVPWTMEIVKDNVWRPVQKTITKETSTTKPTRKEYNEIYELINRKLTSWGLFVEWPSRESLNERNS